ncbi:MAG: fibronectin type III domain-containing protein [Thermodesulfovibrionales bacterium]|jgi:hypothetical protein
MKAILSVIVLSVLLPLRATCVAETSPTVESIPGKHVLIAASDADKSVPGKPTELTLDVAAGVLHLDWHLSPQDPGMVTGYEIVRATDYRGAYDRIGTVGKGISHYEDLSASPRVIYFYKVRAIAGDKYSPFSNVAVGDTPSH